MFQENQIVLSISEFLNYKFPNAIKIEESVRVFTSAKEEFESLRNGVGLRINSSLVLIQLTGKDVLDFLNRVSTNNLKDLKSFEKRNTIFLNEKGRFIDRTTLISLEDVFFLIGSASENKRLFSWVNKFIITEDIQTKDVSSNYTIVDFIGPQAESFLTLLLGKEINTVDSTKVRRFDVDGFTFYFFMIQENNGVKIYKTLIDSEKSASFIDYLFSINSVFDLHVVGDDAFDAFRIENGIPAFPNEISDETNPHEVNLIHEVCFKKGCYIGQEVIARLDTYDKVQKKLFKVTLNNSICSSESLIIIDEGKNEIGKITTLSKDELLPEHKGLAIVRKKAIENKAFHYAISNKNEIEIKISELPSAS
jgi:folate-binding protein YgfZ